MSHGSNATTIEHELAWFKAALDHRFEQHIAEHTDRSALPAPPHLNAANGAYARTIHGLKLDAAERLVLALAIAPQVAPEILDPFLIQNQSIGRRFTEFGGILGQAHNGFLPTVETALFLLAGANRSERLKWRHLFAPEHPFQRNGILILDQRFGDEPSTSAALRLAPQYAELLLSGGEYHPPPSAEFPAQRIATALDWDDLVLDASTRAQIEMINRWLRHGEMLMEEWRLGRRLKPGYRSLFYGPPGTGKTLTAALLGKHAGRAVYRVDLSRVVSKWLGETEKNLGNLFDHAQHQNWILFFDEAEALFGKRTESSSANDRAANQQIAYLLQRLEDFPGVVILATNMRSHMDEAFTRRFQSAILFPMPDAEARHRLWRDNFHHNGFMLASDVDLAAIARDYEIAGGAIVNVLRHAALMAADRDPPQVTADDIQQGVRLELLKEGRYLK
jgi:AAA+ superfamily predicted ATPase